MSQILRDPIFIAIFIFTIFLFFKFFKKNHQTNESNRITSTDISDNSIIFTKNNAISSITYDKETSTVLINIAGAQQDLRACCGRLVCKISEKTKDTHHDGIQASSIISGYTTSGNFFSGTAQTGKYFPAYATTAFTGVHDISLSVSFKGLDTLNDSAKYENRGISFGLEDMEFVLGCVYKDEMVNNIKTKFDEWRTFHQIWMKEKGNTLLTSFAEMENVKFVDKQNELKIRIAKTFNLELSAENSDCYLLAENDYSNPFSKRLFAYNKLDLSDYYTSSSKIYGGSTKELLRHKWAKPNTSFFENRHFLRSLDSFISLYIKDDKGSDYLKIPFNMLGTIEAESLRCWNGKLGGPRVPPSNREEMDKKLQNLIAF